MSDSKRKEMTPVSEILRTIAIKPPARSDSDYARPRRSEPFVPTKTPKCGGIRNFSGGDWHRAQNEAVDKYARKVGPLAMTVYQILCRFAYRDDVVKGLSAKKIQTCANACRERVFAALATLEENGMIKRIPLPGRESVYLLLDLRGA